MKLSVIILCYNFEKYIRQCIDSVLSQVTDFEFEIIVGDDLSSDQSVNILNEYKGRIGYYVNSKNMGLARNTKKLVDMACGEYITYIDGDDFYTDINKLQRQVDFLDKNPEYVMHSTGYTYADEYGNTEHHLIPLIEEPTSEDLLSTNCVSFARMFRNLPDIAAEWMNYLEFHDWVMNFEISLRGKIKCETWIGGAYRITGNGLITGISHETIYEQNQKCRDIFTKRYSEIKC
jgi:glycosyltransferase involved in cell wall biosynthesis